MPKKSNAAAIVKRLEARGYTAGAAQELDDVTILHVAGHGLELYVRSDDADALESILDERAHRMRALQARQPDDVNLALARLEAAEHIELELPEPGRSIVTVKAKGGKARKVKPSELERIAAELLDEAPDA